MATQITNYQCPACTGPLHFVGESGKLECDYCGSNFDVAEIEALYKEKEQKAAKAAEDTENAPETKDGSEWDVSGLNEDWGGRCGGDAYLLLSIVRCRAALRSNHCCHVLPVLWKSDGGAGTVLGNSEAGLRPAL